MKTIKYQADHQELEFHVSDETAAEYEEIVKESERNDWKYEWRNRNELSLDGVLEDGGQIASDEQSPIDELLNAETNEVLYRAIEGLLPLQREIIVRVYLQGEKLSDIARERGVGISTISQVKKRALVKLKKYLQKYFKKP